ncbi:MAG: hypothetical protein ACJ72Z_03030 [Pyrinomonadaceae bacterium]
MHIRPHYATGPAQGCIVGEVVGTGSAVGDGDGHGFFGSSGKHGVGIGVTVGDTDGDTVGVGVWLACSAYEVSEKLDAIPTAFSNRDAPITA